MRGSELVRAGAGSFVAKRSAVGHYLNPWRAVGSSRCCAVEAGSGGRRVVIALYHAILETAANDKQPGVLARREWIPRGGGRSPANIEMKIVVTSAISVEASESGLRLSPVW